MLPDNGKESFAARLSSVNPEDLEKRLSLGGVLPVTHHGSMRKTSRLVRLYQTALDIEARWEKCQWIDPGPRESGKDPRGHPVPEKRDAPEIYRPEASINMKGFESDFLDSLEDASESFGKVICGIMARAAALESVVDAISTHPKFGDLRISWAAARRILHVRAIRDMCSILDMEEPDIAVLIRGPERESGS